MEDSECVTCKGAGRWWTKEWLNWWDNNEDGKRMNDINHKWTLEDIEIYDKATETLGNKFIKCYKCN